MHACICMCIYTRILIRTDAAVHAFTLYMHACIQYACIYIVYIYICAHQYAHA